MSPPPLHLSATDLGTFFENSPIAMGMSRLSDGVFVEVNAAFLALYELTREEIIGHTSLELGLWAHSEQRDEMVRRLPVEMHLHGFPHEYRCKSGRRGRAVASIDLVEIDGAPHMLGSITDLTGYDRLQSSLDQSNERLQLAQEVTGLGIWEWNPLTQRITWSAQQERLFGIPTGSFGGTYEDFIRFVHPADLEMVSREADAALSKNSAFDHHFRIIRPDGAVRWIASRGYVIRDADGKVARVLGVNLDDTEGQHATAALRDSEAKYRGLFAAESDAIIVAELASLRIVDANAAAEKMYGYTLQEFRQLTRLDLSAEPEMTRKLIRSGAAFAAMRWQLRKDGSRFAVEIASNRFHANGIEMTVSAIRDISLRLKLEQDLRDLNAVLESRVAQRTAQLRQLAMVALDAEQRERQSVAHDLHDDIGQLLYAAKVRLEALHSSANGTTVHGEINRIEDLLKNAIEQVRNLTTQLSPPVLERLGLVPALHWLGEEIERVYALHVDVEDDGRPLSFPIAQAAMIFRAVRELLINIFKHARSPDARVEIRVEAATLEITIVDHGVGMPTADDLRIAAGRGFGHASIRERLRYFDGRMRVEPTDGGGTTVVLELPLADTPTAGRPA